MAAKSNGVADRGPCTHFTLAQGVVAKVQFCPACSVFHVEIESMSIRFQATALRDLRDTLSAALAAYERVLDQVVVENESERMVRDPLH